MANTAEAEAVDFEPEEDDLMDEDVQDEERTAQIPRLKSAITGGSSSFASKKTKGRGFREEASLADRNARLSAQFDSLGGPDAERSIEGWIILVTGVHEEAQEDDLHNAFSGFGQIKNLHLNLDRRTGFVKGYALIEYENINEAERAIREMDGTELLTQSINVDWAFSKGPIRRKRGGVRKALKGDNIRELCGWLFLSFGTFSFLGFMYAAVISKLLPPSDNPIIAAIQIDRYYCFLVPLTLPILVIAVYFHWLSMKLFKHA